MRRRPDTLLPIEEAILAVLAARGARDAGPVHGFELAREIAAADAARSLTAHGTLYKALARLEGGALVASRWEDAGDALAGGRPRRRLYEITDAGSRAFASRERVEPRAAFRPASPRTA